VDSRDNVYLKLAILGLVITIFYFVMFSIPLSIQSIQDVALLSMYTMGWGYGILGFFSLIAVFALTRIFRIPEVELQKKGLYNFFSLVFTLPLLASGIFIWFFGDITLGIIIGVILLQAGMWIQDRILPKRTPVMVDKIKNN
jgi:hypothetical protein